ncbi:MAG: LacI family DNA-binding transcriptional regulator [Propionibacteriaceae bacterium]
MVGRRTRVRTEQVPPTLEEVAAAAGVSRSTVSRVVNGSPKVSPDVVTAVKAAIVELDYVPNRAARTLAGSHTHAVALVVPEVFSRFFGDPYFAAVVQGIHSRLTINDYILNLLVSSSDPKHHAQRYLEGGNVDGALVLSHHAGDVQLVELSRRLPLVLGGRPLVDGLADAYFVDVDNVDGAEQATRHLISRGRRRIASIAGPRDMPAAIDRLEGWRRGLRAADLSAERMVQSDFTISGGARAMHRLLEHFDDLDAVFVANDQMAVGALQVLIDSGRQVPGDVAVVGYDDSPVATSGRLPLSTVRQPSEQMGTDMAEMLIMLLRGERPAQPAHLLPTTLIVRSSS